jgi:hypothetical protein
MSLTPEQKTTDEVISAVRQIKRSLAESFDFDLHRMLEDARNRQKSSGREIIPQPPRKRSAETT